MLTGRQYKESLKDGRKVYFEGRVIEDLGSDRPAQPGGTAGPHPGHHRDGPAQSGGGLFAQKLVTRKNYDIERARALALKAAGLSGA